MICTRNTLRQVALMAVAALLLSACATGDFGGLGGSQNERRARTLADDGQYADAAGIYIGLASGTSGAERDRLTLLAVEQWLFAGDGRRAESALRQVATPAGGELLWLWTADTAALALWDGKPDEALTLLDPLSRQPLPPAYRSRIEALRGDAWFQKDDPLRAIDLYRQRETWLDSPAEIERNRLRMWQGLRVSNVQTLRQAAEIAYDSEVRGWLTLAALANSTGQQGIGWSNGLARWQESFAGHPAMAVLGDLQVERSVALSYPRQIALLLPLSGNNASFGRAIRNGFLGAYFAAVGGAETRQQIRVYDVDSGNGTAEAYQQAVADGAEFVVGPLLRANVTELASELLLPVPVLALNYLPEETAPPAGFYQYALAPEDEASAAAQKGIADAGRRAVALVPNNDWGRRVLGSFATEFEGLGGNLLDYKSYDPDDQDFSFEIEGLMALSESVQRYQRLRANIGGPLQFDPRRRQDIDLIFLAADARAGRLIKSQLKFHYAGDLPVYSTSVIYSMDGRSDADLDGLMFADAPWVVSPPPWIADFPALYDEYWPGERRLARLHAMGYDAYHLVGALFNAGEQGITEMTGATGQLFETRDGRIHRKLAWARFEDGKPVPVAASESQRDWAGDDAATGSDDETADWSGLTDVE